MSARLVVCDASTGPGYSELSIRPRKWNILFTPVLLYTGKIEARSYRTLYDAGRLLHGHEESQPTELVTCHQHGLMTL
jgi:hypothetical protein